MRKAPWLKNYRALDLTDEKGFLCGMILADLGVDVIKIEKVGGDSSRNIGPFYHGIPDPQRSLYWFAYNANKRSITLNVETRDGQEIFKRLAKNAHFIIESYEPGFMESLSLDYSTLSELNPKVIMTSITPFGQTGPYKDYKASEMIALAMGGYMGLCGDPDRPPVQLGIPLAYLMGSAEAAASTLIAHCYREVTGEGQHVDTSIQQTIVMLTLQAVPFWELNQVLLHRSGSFRSGMHSGVLQRQIWRCKDGYVAFAIYAGLMFAARANAAIAKWMDEEGMATDYLRQMDWEQFDAAKLSQSDWESIEKPVARFMEAHTVEELFKKGAERGVPIFPVSTPKMLWENEQLSARNFWNKVEHPELGETLIYPGPLAKLSEGAWQTRCRAPLIGEHNEEVYQGELNFSRKDTILLKEAGVI